MKVDVTVQTDVSRSGRARQLEGLFDVPPAESQTQTWQLDVPIEDRDWSVGLIAGPSGSGKTIVLRSMFGSQRVLSWDTASVIDAFDQSLSMKDVAAVCQAVGFNTIPAWLRPYGILSTGERFRVDVARRMLESSDDETIVVDEFTSVVDRQVAQIGAHAVAKYVRRNGRRFVAATCHYDVIDWLQPDWIIEPATRSFTWRSVQPRPRLDGHLATVDYSAWQLFAPFHYLTATLNRAARCYVLFVNGEPTSFAGLLHRPHARTKNLIGVSRLVTLPDWQGLGLAFVLVDALGAAARACGRRLRTYPAHPALINGFYRSRLWALKQRPNYANSSGHQHGPNSQLGDQWRAGSRPCAVFEYIGEPFPEPGIARRLILGD